MSCPCGRRSVHRTSSYSDTEIQPAARRTSCRRTTWLQPASSGGPTVTHCCTIPTVICTCLQNLPPSVDSIDLQLAVLFSRHKPRDRGSCSTAARRESAFLTTCLEQKHGDRICSLAHGHAR